LTNSHNEKEFREALREKGIDLVLRTNDEGRIYGATFINHNERCVLNGSRLGKEFSANVLNERFGEEQTNAQEKRKEEKTPLRTANVKQFSINLFKLSSMQNEDDLRGLAKVMEFMRGISILLVVINIYWFCYQSIKEWGIDIGVIV
jgi:hypothetical protein